MFKESQNSSFVVKSPPIDKKVGQVYVTFSHDEISPPHNNRGKLDKINELPEEEK